MKNYSSTSLSCLQPYNFGFDGFQSTDSDDQISVMMGSNSDYIGTGLDNSNYQQLSDGSMDLPSPFSYFSPVTYSSIMHMDDFGLASPSPMMDNHYSFPFDNSIKSHTLLAQPNDQPNIKDARKCTSGARFRQRNNTTNNIANTEALKISNKRKAIEQLIDPRQLKTQGSRRSQKLSDKITALQEIVCPYGKTDTASVLQEACIYIRIIHQELRRLSISYFESRSFQSQLQGDTERQPNLRSRGLCLVPISIMKSLTRESWGDQATARTSRRPRNI